MDFPDDIEKKILEMSERSKMPVDKLKEKWEEYYNHYRNDGQFETDDACHDYILQIFLGRYVLRPPVTPYDFVPIGFSQIMTSKAKGTKSANLFILDSRKNIQSILLRGDMTDQLKNISLFKLYKGVDLGKLSDDTLIADDRAEFNTPNELEVTPEKFIEILNIPKTDIKNSFNMLSKKGSTGYVVRSDWKCVQGVIKSARFPTEDAEYQWGFVTLVDSSILHDEPKILTDGTTVPPGFDVRISPWLNQYPVDSEVKVYGTIDMDSKTEKPFMSAYCIIPVHIASLGVS